MVSRITTYKRGRMTNVTTLGYLKASVMVDSATGLSMLETGMYLEIVIGVHPSHSGLAMTSKRCVELQCELCESS